MFMTVSAMLHFISIGDHKLMRKLNNWRAPRWVRLWSLAATRAGDGWLWYLFGLLIAIWGGVTRWSALGAAGSAALIGTAIFISLKHVSGRKRPCEIEPHCWATLLPPDQFSFPSGHTITAFSVGMALAAFYPFLLPVLLFCAISIGASRVLLGMHFLSDVLAGAAIGTVLGLTAAQFFA
jgi:undecaprenyl-diphosphatase